MAAVFSGEVTAAEEGSPGDDEESDSLFGVESPPFELGWSHGPVIGVVNFGRPFGVSASYAGVVGPDRWCVKPVQWSASCSGVMAGIEAGLGGGRLGVGAGIVKAGDFHLGVMASAMRAWSSPAFFEGFPVANYRGLEIIAGYRIYHVSAGVYRSVKDSSAGALYTWGLGAGF